MKKRALAVSAVALAGLQHRPVPGDRRSAGQPRALTALPRTVR